MVEKLLAHIYRMTGIERVLDVHIERACRPGYDAGLLDGISFSLLGVACYIAYFVSLRWVVGL